MHVLRLCEMQRSPFPPPLNAMWLISFANDLQIIKIFFFPVSSGIAAVHSASQREEGVNARRVKIFFKIMVYNTRTSRCMQMSFPRRSFRCVDRSDHLEKGKPHMFYHEAVQPITAQFGVKCNRSHAGVWTAMNQEALVLFLHFRSSNTCNHLTFT